MKRALFLSMAIVMIASVANAALTDLGNGIIEDDSTGLVWVQDLSTFTSQNAATKVTNVDAYDLAGETDWTMASQAQVEALIGTYSVSDIKAVFLPSKDDDYFASYGPAADNVYFEMAGSWFSYATSAASDLIGAWVVSDSYTPDPVTPPAVPVPGAMLLASIGAALTGYIRTRKSL